MCSATSMGDALECERAVDDRADTQQHTTTGLAYYRTRPEHRQPSPPAGTTGRLRPKACVVHWTGDLVDPPQNAAPIAP